MPMLLFDCYNPETSVSLDSSALSFTLIIY